MKTLNTYQLRLVVLAGGLSAAALIAAFAFQHLGGLAPCDLCLTQRWAHVLVVASVGLSCLVQRRIALFPGILASLFSAAGAAYHVGVEKLWWAAPSSCSGGGGLVGLTGTSLLSMSMNDPVVRCTDIAWEMLGISMAGWNLVASTVIAGAWGLAALSGRGTTCGLSAD